MLLDALCQTLELAYPDNPVITERTLRGMSKPCFSLIVIQASQSALIGNRYAATWYMDVRFFPRDDGTESAYEDLHRLAQELYGALEDVQYVDDDTGAVDRYYGQQMRHEIVDNVLHMFVSYSFLLRRDLPPGALMRHLTHMEYIKEREIK